MRCEFYSTFPQCVVLQILYAEREFMAAQVKHANANSAALAEEITGLKHQLASAQAACRISPASVLDPALEDSLLSSSSGTFGSISNDIFADANRCGQSCVPFLPISACTPGILYNL